MRVEWTMRVLVAAVLIGMAGVVARVVQLQVFTPAQLSAYMPDRASTRPVEGYRGELYDRAGRLIATSRMGYRVFVDPVELVTLDEARPGTLDETIVELAEAIDTSPAEIGEKIMHALASNREVLSKLSPIGGAERAQDGRGGLGVLLAALHDKAGTHASESEDKPEGLRRYLVVSEMLKPHQLAAVKNRGLRGVHLERRAMREYPGGDLMASVVGKVGFEQSGLMGAELLLDSELVAHDGKVQYVRDAWGRPLWIERGAIEPPTHGRDVRLSIDLEIQRIALDELNRGVEEADAAGGRIVVVDPLTGEVLAIADVYRQVPGLSEYPWQPEDDRGEWPVEARRYKTLPDDLARFEHPALGRARCVEDVYEPGSTFKPVVWSLVTEAGLAEPTEVIDTEGGRWRTSYGRSIEDVTKRAEMTWSQVLENSSNIGMVKVTQRIKPEALRRGITRFGFGSVTGTKLPGEAHGIVTPLKHWTKYTHTSVSFGHEISVTPVQMVRAYCALVRTGKLAGTILPLRMTVPTPDDPANAIVERVIDPDVAAMAREAMRHVGKKVEVRMKDEQPRGGWHYPMLGKSGTAEIPLGKAPEGFRRPRGARGYFEDQYNSSFVAAAPLDVPRLVVIVVIDDPGPERIMAHSHYGSAVAGPVTRRVLERSLEYLGVPPCPETQSDPGRVAAR